MPIPEWSIRECQCTFCRAHAALSASDLRGMLRFVESDALVRYRSGLRIADFLLCSRCGVYVGARTEIEGRAFGIVNVRALVEQPAECSIRPMDYDGESVETRRARRARRWTPLGRSL